MTNGALDAGVEEFILSNIQSVEQMEILLLLRLRQQMDAESINQELRTSLGSVQKRLDSLSKQNLISTVGEEKSLIFRYDPPDRYKDVIDRLAQLYTTHRVSLINLIFSKPPDMLKDFSEAFRIREKDKNK